MKQSLGLIEVRGLSSAVAVADAMVKAANIRLEEIENTRGNGYMTVKVTGDVGAVKAAVAVGKAEASAFGTLVSVDVIARPVDSTGTLFVEYADHRTRPMCYKEEVIPVVEPTQDGTAEDCVSGKEMPADLPVPEEPASELREEKTGEPAAIMAEENTVPKGPAHKTVRRRRKAPAKPKIE